MSTSNPLQLILDPSVTIWFWVALGLALGVVATLIVAYQALKQRDLALACTSPRDVRPTIRGVTHTKPIVIRDTYGLVITGNTYNPGEGEGHTQ